MENRIKEYIKEASIMQKELAEKLNMTTVGMSKLTNAPTLKLETYQKFADALGVPVWRLFLSDAEIEEIRSEDAINKPANEFCCPKCGAVLKVVPTNE